MKNNTFSQVVNGCEHRVGAFGISIQAAFAASPIEMKAVAFLPTTALETKCFVEFVEDVRRKRRER